MTTEGIFFSVVALILLLVMLWLTRMPAGAPAAPNAEAKLLIEELFPLHCRHFPQVRQALASSDEAFLKRRASPKIQQRSRSERREVARQFLSGLREDFSRLDRLGRTVAALSPAVNRKQEAERFWLAVRFGVLYRLAWLRLQTGGVPVPQLARLTELVGSLAAQIETAMTALEDVPLMRLRSGLSA